MERRRQHEIDLSRRRQYRVAGGNASPQCYRTAKELPDVRAISKHKQLRSGGPDTPVLRQSAALVVLSSGRYDLGRAGCATGCHSPFDRDWRADASERQPYEDVVAALWSRDHCEFVPPLKVTDTPRPTDERDDRRVGAWRNVGT